MLESEKKRKVEQRAEWEEYIDALRRKKLGRLRVRLSLSFLPPVVSLLRAYVHMIGLEANDWT